MNEYYQLASLRTSDIQKLETRRFLSFTILVEPMSSITFHWLTHRIEAYVRICVLALLVERVEELACSQSWFRIRGALDALPATEFYPST